MVKKVSVLLFFAILVISLSGCATGRKQKDLEMQGLRNQISVLETQLETKDQEIESLKDTLNKAGQVEEIPSKKRVVPEIKSRPSAKQIQMALRNAGYNPGSIDGRMGRQTKDAIKAFQKDNNLVADGKAGKETWNLLKEYLYKKIK